MPDPKDNINADPKGGQSAVDTSKGQEPKEGTAAPTPTRPEWLKENFKSAEEQAKGYAAAEAKMHEATKEAAKLREELTRLNAQINPPAGADRNTQSTPPSDSNPIEIPNDVRAKLEAKYGVPAEQVVMMADVLNMVIKPIKDNLYGSQVESAKERAEKDTEHYPYYGRYKGEIETFLNRYPIADRTKPETIQTCYSWVVNQHLKDIEKEWEEKGKKSISGSPAEVPAFAGESAPGASTPPPSTFVLTEEQKKIQKIMGVSDEDMAKYNKKGVYR